MLDVREISKRFADGTILNGVSFVVPAASVAAIVGPSGCGKTTLLRILAGLERADSGSVTMSGAVVDSSAVQVPTQQRRIGMVFQDLALWPHMRAWKHLEFVLRGRGLSRRARIEKARGLLETLKIGNRAEAYPADLSGGEQQRLAFARAIVTDPPLLLLDEPVAHLNAELRELVLNEVLRRTREDNVSAVIATHDPADAEMLRAVTITLAR